MLAIRNSAPAIGARKRSIHPNIVDCHDPVLRQISRPVDIQNRATVEPIWNELELRLDEIRNLHHFSNCAGLSAIQLGISIRMAVVWTPQTGYLHIANPEILEYSAQITSEFEGCLSFFDVRGHVRRPSSILLRYLQKDFSEREESFSSWTSRIIQHEVDHMNGIVYTDRMHPNESTIPYEDFLILRAAV
jgi:peptide deformylase